MSRLCICCQERPVHVKKRGLCVNCYQISRRGNLSEFKSQGLTPSVQRQWMHERELEFIRNFFRHGEWVYQPAQFKVGSVSYTPDFYDRHRGVFIEVAGTHQAFRANEEKYITFQQIFPTIPFEIRKTNGELLEKRQNGRYIWGDNEEAKAIDSDVQIRKEKARVRKNIRMESREEKIQKDAAIIKEYMGLPCGPSGVTKSRSAVSRLGSKYHLSSNRLCALVRKYKNLAQKQESPKRVELQRVEAGGSVSVTTAKGIARALHVKLEELV